MIKINFKMLDDPIIIDGVTSIILKNHTLFAKLVEQIYQYTEESIDLRLFDSKYESLKEAELMVITDILGHDVNSTPVLRSIYKDLALQISEKPEIKTKIEAKLEEVTGLINEEIIDFEIDLECDEITLDEVFKALGVKVEIKTDTIFERVFEIIQVFKYLAKKRLMIMINLATYLTIEEMRLLCEYATLQNIDFLLLDTHEFGGVKNQYILDEDYVLLKPNLV